MSFIYRHILMLTLCAMAIQGVSAADDQAEIAVKAVAQKWFSALAKHDIEKAFSLYDFEVFRGNESQMPALKKAIYEALEREIKYTKEQWHDAVVGDILIDPEPLVFEEYFKEKRPELPDDCRYVTIKYHHLPSKKILPICYSQETWKIFPNLYWFEKVARENPIFPPDEYRLVKVLFDAIEEHDIQAAAFNFICPSPAENLGLNFSCVDAEKALDAELTKNAVFWKNTRGRLRSLDTAIFLEFVDDGDKWQCRKAEVGISENNTKLVEDEPTEEDVFYITLCYHVKKTSRWAVLANEQFFKWNEQVTARRNNK